MKRGARRGGVREEKGMGEREGMRGAVRRRGEAWEKPREGGRVEATREREEGRKETGERGREGTWAGKGRGEGG